MDIKKLTNSCEKKKKIDCLINPRGTKGLRLTVLIYSLLIFPGTFETGFSALLTQLLVLRNILFNSEIFKKISDTCQ